MHGMHHKSKDSGQEQSWDSISQGQDEVGEEGEDKGNKESSSGPKYVTKPPKERSTQEHSNGKHRLHVTKR